MSALPAGTWPVAAGVLINGIASYVYLALPARAGHLSTEAYALFSAVWFATFIVGPGLFVPLEQAVARGVSARRALAVGGHQLERRAARWLAIAAAVVLVAGVVLAQPLGSALFDDRWAASLVVAGAVAGFGLFQLAKGVASGHREMGAYGEILGIEGLVRVGLSVVLVAIDVKDPLWYGSALIVSPLAAVGLVRLRHRRNLDEGPDVQPAELGRSMPSLLVAQLSAQALANSVPLALVALASTAVERELAGQLAAGFVLSRVPLFLFQAVQAALLPRLTADIVAGRSAQALDSLRRLEAVLAALMGVALVGLVGLGPWATRLLFGAEFNITWADMLWFSGGGALFVLGFLHHQALVAAGEVDTTAVAWLAGLFVCVGGLSALSVANIASDVGRVEVAYVTGIGVVVAIARTRSIRVLTSMVA